VLSDLIRDQAWDLIEVCQVTYHTGTSLDTLHYDLFSISTFVNKCYSGINIFFKIMSCTFCIKKEENATLQSRFHDQGQFDSIPSDHTLRRNSLLSGIEYDLRPKDTRLLPNIT
jgi:hypothetical protein